MRELEMLTAANVINAETAENIRRYYASRESGERRNTLFIVFGVIGSLFVGLGIILLVAYNWKALSQNVKTVIAFALLAAGIGVHGIACFLRRTTAWQESASVVMMLIIGAVIALIGQIYHIPSDTTSFMLTWMLLALPSVYLLNASSSAFLYIAGISVWAALAQSEGGHTILFWPLAAAVVPHYMKHMRENPFSVRSSLISWGFALAVCVSLGITLEKVIPGTWIIVYSSYLAVLFLVGGIWFADAPSIWQRPFYVVGIVGTSVLSLVFTFRECWHDVGLLHFRSGGRFHADAAVVDYLLLGGLFALAVYLFVISIKKRRSISVIMFGAFPVVALVTFMYASYREFPSPALLFNAYALALGVSAIVSGVRAYRQGIVNGGMLIIAVLIIMRFIDMDVSLLGRGIVFLVIGSAFLIANAVLSKVFRRSVP